MRAQKAHRQAEEVARDAETKVEAAKAAAANEIQETLAANQVAMLEFERKTRTEADDRIAVAEGRARDAETKADNAAAEAKRAEEGRSAAEEPQRRAEENMTRTLGTEQSARGLDIPGRGVCVRRRPCRSLPLCLRARGRDLL